MRNAVSSAVIFIAVFFTTPIYVHAQLDDTQLRTQVKLQYSPIKRLNLYGMFRSDLRNNLSTFRRNNFEIGGDFKLKPWLEAGLSYRFATSYERDFHRFEVSLSARKKLLNDKAQLAFTSRVQSNMDYINKDYFSLYNPVWVYRNKLRFRYSPSKKWDVYVFSELFATTKERQSQFYRLRSGTGVSRTFKKQHELTLGYFFQNEFNIRNADIIQCMEIEYTYDIKKKKKKTAPTY